MSDFIKPVFKRSRVEVEISRDAEGRFDALAQMNGLYVEELFIEALRRGLESVEADFRLGGPRCLRKADT
ncbi:MAG: hypothetical protein M3Q61_04630 [Chloroflexota bacterium]|nr:hypothetical protein [Chloroflexota bacterium]